MDRHFLYFPQLYIILISCKEYGKCLSMPVQSLLCALKCFLIDADAVIGRCLDTPYPDPLCLHLGQDALQIAVKPYPVSLQSILLAPLGVHIMQLLPRQWFALGDNPYTVQITRID